jgi:hypothetical protein
MNGRPQGLPFFMKFSAFSFSFSVILLTLFSCTDIKESREYREVAMDRDSLIESLKIRNQQILDFSTEYEKIEKNLMAIDSNKASILQIHSNPNLDTRQKINAMIADIYIALDQNKKSINSFENSLAKEKKAKKNDFKKVVLVLRKSLDEKEEEIKNLEKVVANLQLEVRNLKEAVAFKEKQLASRDTALAKSQEKIRQQQELINEKDKQLTRVYLIKGSTKELSKAGILVNKGGVLGLGAVKMMGQKVPSANLQTLNSKTDKVVNIGPYATYKRRVISNHPSDSYFFVAQKDGQLVLKISYPDRFWSLSRYLVISLD